MIVVSNTTPLIGLASIQKFDLLQQLFGEVYIPQAVYDEAAVAGREEGAPGIKLQINSKHKILERVAIAFAKHGINSIGQTGMSVLSVMVYLW